MNYMKHKKKKFKAIVIHKHTLSTIICCMIFVVIMSGVFLFSRSISSAEQNDDYIEDIYISALESSLPMEEKENKHSIFESLFGFNVTDPKSILFAGSIFHMVVEEENKQGGVVSNILTQTPAPTQMPAATEPPTQMQIQNVQISKGMSISNATSYSVNADSLANENLDFNIDDNGVQVLIVHTHTTESFTSEGKTTYIETDSDRSTDSNKNIVMVGNKICEVLNSKGIKTIHDTTVHDYPSYNGAYTRALSTIQKNIKENPSIKVVLDVHRDGLIRADGTKLKVSSEINGVQTAQVMLVIGTNSMGLKHDNWLSNMRFAAKIQKKANELYPNLMRPMNLREERFNQQLTKGSLIVEVGSNGNTLNEALLGGEAVANAIAEVLKNG